MALVLRSGFAPLSDAEGLALFDAGLADPRPALSAARLHLPALRAQARAEALPAVLADLVRTPARRAGASAEKSLPDRLASLPEAERGAAVLEFLRANIAEGLGLESGADVDPEIPLLELGFDSLTALQYRNRLNALTGLRLSAGVILDHPTTAALAEYLLSEMEVADSGAAAAAPGEGSLLSTLMRNAHERGRVEEFAATLDSVASFRATFAGDELGGIEPYAVRLAAGDGAPLVFCVPSIVPVSGPHEYARLARRFRGQRDLLALRWPGFAAAEALPADAEAAIELQVGAIEDAAGSGPLVLAGHSSGGAFAHAIAARLERRGRAVAAVVLIDSYHPSQLEPGAMAAAGLGAIGRGIVAGMLAAGEASVEIDDARLTATAAYMRLLGQLELAETAAPLLLVRAGEAIGDDPGEADWRPRWELPHELLEVPGNHLSMMNAHAETTADAISRWLDSSLGDAREKQANKGKEVRR